MKWQWKQWVVVLGSAAMMAAGCGSDSGGGDGSTGGGTGVDGVDGTTLPSTAITVADHISESDFDTEAASGDLQAVVQEVKGAGYTTFASAGRTEDADGNSAVWGAYLNGSGEESWAVLTCTAAGECSTIRATANESGAVNIESGAVSWTAAPAMLKDLAAQDHGGTTSIAQAALTVDEVPEVNIQSRMAHIANAFGKAQGVDLQSWTDFLVSSRVYSGARYEEYATVGMLREAIRSGGPADALIWVGAGVREKLGNEYKTIGMTANRGLYGDVTVRGVDEIRQWLKDNPYGGPGLVVLLGEETHGDGGTQANNPAAIFNEFSDIDTHRIVVAVRGRADAATILNAGQAFLTDYVGGKTLRESLDAGTAVFEAAGSTATLVTNREGTSAENTLPGQLDSLLGESPPEGAVRSNMYLNIVNVCIAPDGSGYPEEEGQVNFFVDVTFDGPFFTGSRQWEVEGEPLQATVSGMMLGREPGAGVFLTYTGDVKPSVKNITVWGAGAVEDRTDVDNPNRIFFDGSVIATEYQNAAGDTCQLKSPTLSGSTSEQLSWIDFDLPK